MKRPFASSRLCVFALCFFLFLSSRSAFAQNESDAYIDGDGDSVNLRAAPSLQASILAILPDRTPLSVMRLSPDKQWLYVTTDTYQTGWVYRELVFYTTLEPEAIMNGRIQLSPDVAEQILAIYERGQAFGLHPDVFVKVGDSISVAAQWLKPVAEGFTQTADYAYLDEVIDSFTVESFARSSAATGIGWSAYGVLQPEYVMSDECFPAESPLMCEYRLMQPAIALIMFGTNDVGILDPAEYRYNMTRIIETTIGQGIIPVLSTIPPRIDYEERVDRFNQIVRDLAAEYHLPLVDYFAAMWTLPGFGLDEDGVHPNSPPHGFVGSVDFSAENLYYGYVARNLVTLQMLDAVHRVITGA